MTIATSSYAFTAQLNEIFSARYIHRIAPHRDSLVLTAVNDILNFKSINLKFCL